jgi:hypothetical protein
MAPWTHFSLTMVLQISSCSVATNPFLLGLLWALVLILGSAQACEFTKVKSAIDQVTNPKEDVGKRFKALVEDGWNSERVLFDLTDKDLHPLMDDCRPEVEAYLNQLGYPSVH